jgi:hypothetical protein
VTDYDGSSLSEGSMNKLTTSVALALIAMSVPVAAYAATTHPGASATVLRVDGCRIAHNADRSISVDCPKGHWAVLQWTFRTRRPDLPPSHFAVNSARPLTYPAKVHETSPDGFSMIVKTVTQRVHANTIASVVGN